MRAVRIAVSSSRIRFCGLHGKLGGRVELVELGTELDHPLTKTAKRLLLGVVQVAFVVLRGSDDALSVSVALFEFSLETCGSLRLTHGCSP